MQISTSASESTSGPALAMELQSNLLKKAKDMKAQEVSTLIAALPPPAKSAQMGTAIDLSA